MTNVLQVLSIIFGLICMLLVTNGKKFDPYVDNGGTVLGIAGYDFCLIASDTRLSEGYIIRSRNTSRIFVVPHCL